MNWYKEVFKITEADEIEQRICDNLKLIDGELEFCDWDNGLIVTKNGKKFKVNVEEI